MSKRKTDWERGIEAGILWSVAVITETYDEPTLAADLLSESGVNPRNADESDRVGVNKAARELKRRLK